MGRVMCHGFYKSVNMSKKRIVKIDILKFNINNIDKKQRELKCYVNVL